MKGLEVGEANKAPFDKIGLAMQRIGNSYLQLGKLEDSITWLKKALLNDRYFIVFFKFTFHLSNLF